jgi:hypothetical protein
VKGIIWILLIFAIIYLIRKFLSKPKVDRLKYLPPEGTQNIKNGKHFQFHSYKDESEVSLITWYRLRKWKRPNYLKMQTEWSSDLIPHIIEETVVGVSFDNRKDTFLLVGDYPDFKIFLEREPDNPVDPNAIKVMG